MSDNRALEAVLDRVAGLLYRQIGLRPEPTLRGRLRRCIRDDAADRDQDIETYLADVLDQSEVLQGLVNRVRRLRSSDTPNTSMCWPARFFPVCPGR
jgi:chemotaxis protein methyltransferase CheR